MVIRIPSGNGVCPDLPHFEESRCATVLSDVVSFVCAIAVPTAIDLASILLKIAGLVRVCERSSGCSANWPYGFSRYQVRSTTGSLGTGPS
jgi:hypothetical protein